VAIFAGNTFGQFERTAALFRCRVQRVAGEAFWRLFGFRIEFQNPGDAFTDVSGQRLIRVAVFVLDDPGGVLIL